EGVDALTKFSAAHCRAALFEQGRVKLLALLAFGSFRTALGMLCLLAQGSLFGATFCRQPCAIVGKEREHQCAHQHRRSDDPTPAQTRVAALKGAHMPDALPALQ